MISSALLKFFLNLLSAKAESETRKNNVPIAASRENVSFIILKRSQLSQAIRDITNIYIIIGILIFSTDGRSIFAKMIAIHANEAISHHVTTNSKELAKAIINNKWANKKLIRP
jgi:hypothetical protein